MANSVRPENRQEFMSKLVQPYSKQYGNPNQPFSEPLKAGQPEYNRALEISVKDDTDKDFSIGIKDLDEAVMYYFNNVLKLSVIQNNTKIMVPIIYGSPENWKGVQADGYYRDGYGKLMAPLLVFKRDSVTQNRTLGNKLDGNIAKNVQLFERKYSKRNVYSNFGLLNNRNEEKEYIITVTPDYVTIKYTCIVWTHFVEQMDKIIEALNFASRSYWGDPSKFRFLADIESFENNVTYEVGDDRLVRTTFNITLNGYLIPNTINAELAKYSRVFSVSKVVFGLETANTKEDYSTLTKGKKRSIASIASADSVNRTQNVTKNYDFDPAIVSYLNTNKEELGTYINPTTVRFPIWATAPTGVSAPTIDNFIVSVNGQLIERSAIVSFASFTFYSELVIDPSVLQYDFKPNDTIFAVGKFA